MSFLTNFGVGFLEKQQETFDKRAEEDREDTKFKMKTMSEEATRRKREIDAEEKKYTERVQTLLDMAPDMTEKEAARWASDGNYEAFMKNPSYYLQRVGRVKEGDPRANKAAILKNKVGRYQSDEAYEPGKVGVAEKLFSRNRGKITDAGALSGASGALGLDEAEGNNLINGTYTLEGGPLAGDLNSELGVVSDAIIRQEQLLSGEVKPQGDDEVNLVAEYGNTPEVRKGALQIQAAESRRRVKEGILIHGGRLDNEFRNTTSSKLSQGNAGMLYDAADKIPRVSPDLAGEVKPKTVFFGKDRPVVWAFMVNGDGFWVPLNMTWEEYNAK